MDAVCDVAERNDIAAYINEKDEYIRIENGKETALNFQQAKEYYGVTDYGYLPQLCTLSRRNMEEAEYDRLKEEMLAVLLAKGYDCRDRLPANSMYFQDFLEVLKDMEYENGEVDQYRITGILSEDFYSRGMENDPMYKYIRMIYPMEVFTHRYELIAREEEKRGAAIPADGGLYYQTFPVRISYGNGPGVKIGIQRDTEVLDDEIMRFVGRNDWIYAHYNYYSYLMGKPIDYYSYMEKVRQIRVIRMVVVILGAFIITVCMVQIVNTLQAGMRLHRRELWLYEVVGMSRNQQLKMQLIEYGMSAVTAFGLGMLISFLFSFLFVEKLLGLGGDGFEYRWPLGVALVMGVILSALIIGVNLLEMHQFIQNREKPG